jgi:hypothetical protein
MDGIDLAREVKLRWPLLPVILTSGHPRGRVGELPPGVAYMPKPWQPLNVLIAAERALASRAWCAAWAGERERSGSPFSFGENSEEEEVMESGSEDRDLGESLSKLGATSMAEIEKLIAELQETRNFFESEGERIQRETARYNPCLRRGPLSLDYWTRLPSQFWHSTRRLAGVNWTIVSRKSAFRVTNLEESPAG